MENVTEIESTEEDKKLNAKEIISIVLFVLSTILFVGGIVLSSIKLPIKNSIYSTNMTLEERQELWNELHDRQFDNYYNRYPLSYYSSYVKENNSSAEFYYRSSYSNIESETKILKLEIIYNSTKQLESCGLLYLVKKDNNLNYYSITIEVNPRSYTLIVPADFEIENYDIYINDVKVKNDSTSYRKSVTSYDDYLEIIKRFEIEKEIKEELGEYPTNNTDFENSFSAVKIIRTFVFILSVGLFVLAVFILAIERHNKRINDSSDYSEDEYSEGENEEEFLDKEPQFNENIIEEIKADIKEDIIKEIKDEVNTKKVECFHCGSMYRESLDECPNCGSAKVDKE